MRNPGELLSNNSGEDHNRGFAGSLKMTECAAVGVSHHGVCFWSELETLALKGAITVISSSTF